MSASWKKSVLKAAKALFWLWVAGKLTPEGLVALLPDQIEKITVGAALLGLVNYVKHRFNLKWL